MICRRFSIWSLATCLCTLESLLLVSGCAHKKEDEQSVNQRESTRIPLAVSSQTGFLVFKAYLNGAEITMAIDTAANMTTFRMDLMDKLELKAKETTGYSNRVTGSHLPLKVAHVKDFRVGDLSYNFDADFVDLSPPNEGISAIREPAIEGLLGMDFLLKWQAVIDCQERVLIIRNP